MFGLWKKIDQANRANKTLWIVLCILAAICLWQGAAIRSIPNELRIYVTPDQVMQGVSIKPGQVSPIQMYSMVFQLFSAINTWNTSGKADYKKAIVGFRHYFSGSFEQYLLDDYVQRKVSGELSRTRTLTLPSAGAFNPKNVKALSDGTWEVNLTLLLTEREDGTVIKKVLIDYPIRVKRVNVSRIDNQWGYVLDGFVSPPKRIKTYV